MNVNFFLFSNIYIMAEIFHICFAYADPRHLIEDFVLEFECVMLEGNDDDERLRSLNEFKCKMARQYTDTDDKEQLLDFFENNFIYWPREE